MKLSKTILTALAFSALIYADANSQCDNSAIDYINGNEVRATILNDGAFFWDRNDGKFLVPFALGENPTSTIFAAALWLGGIDNTGQLKVSWNGWGTRYIPGPIDDSTLAVLEDSCQNFDNIWKVSREDILSIKEDFEDNGIIENPIPHSIKKWPGKGNPFFENIFGFLLPDQELAPFFDRNNNGLFEPSNGEYPVIDPSFPNVIPNEITWSVFNQTVEENSQYSELAIKAEIHFMTYAFNCDEYDPLNYTVFTRHKLLNKSGGDLSEFKIGIWMDADLGCFFDDYFGCDTLLNTQYIYNSDNEDGAEPQCIGIPTYGENPPVQAVTFLNQKMGNLNYFNRAPFGNPPPATVEPENATEFYNYLTGKWRDGTPMTLGGSGCNPTNIESSNYVFHSLPTDPNGWNMVNVQLPHYDWQTVMSTESISFPEGGQLILDAAYSYHRQPGANYLENVNVALSEIPSIQEYYNNGFSGSCSQVVRTKESFDNKINPTISPNPSNGTFDLDFEKTSTPSEISLFDFSGNMITLEEIPPNSDSHTIDLGGQLQTGIYFIKHTFPDGKFSMKKLIVK